MTVLITGDLHLSENPRDAYRWAMMDTLRGLIRNREVSTFIILGDLCNEKDHHGAQLVNAVVEELHKFAELAEVIVLRGNHDAADVDHPFFRFTRLLPGVSFITVPTGVLVDPVGSCLFLPWEADTAAWDGIEFDQYDAIFCHQTFGGAKSASGVFLDGPDIYFPTDADTFVVSGDVHVPQQVGPVTYVGAPYTVDFGDTFQPRVLLCTELSTISIRLHGPRKRLIEIGSLDDWKQATVKPGDIAKVRVKVGPTTDWPKLRQAIRQWGEEQGVDIWAVMPEAARGLPLARSTTAVRLTDADLVRRYAFAKQTDKETLDLGLSLTESVV